MNLNRHARAFGNALEGVTGEFIGVVYHWFGEDVYRGFGEDEAASVLHKSGNQPNFPILHVREKVGKVMLHVTTRFLMI